MKNGGKQEREEGKKEKQAVRIWTAFVIWAKATEHEAEGQGQREGSIRSVKRKGGEKKPRKAKVC